MKRERRRHDEIPSIEGRPEDSLAQSGWLKDRQKRLFRARSRVETAPAFVENTPAGGARPELNLLSEKN